jgi:hypothetical protein
MSRKRFSQGQNPPLKLSLPALYPHLQLKKYVVEISRHRFLFFSSICPINWYQGSHRSRYRYCLCPRLMTPRAVGRISEVDLLRFAPTIHHACWEKWDRHTRLAYRSSEPILLSCESCLRADEYELDLGRIHSGPGGGSICAGLCPPKVDRWQ